MPKRDHMGADRAWVALDRDTYHVIKHLSEFYRVSQNEVIVDLLNYYRSSEEYQYADNFEGPPLDEEGLREIRRQAVQKLYWKQRGRELAETRKKKRRAALVA